MFSWCSGQNMFLSTLLEDSLTILEIPTAQQEVLLNYLWFLFWSSEIYLSEKQMLSSETPVY